MSASPINNLVILLTSGQRSKGPKIKPNNRAVLRLCWEPTRIKVRRESQEKHTCWAGFMASWPARGARVKTDTTGAQSPE